MAINMVDTATERSEIQYHPPVPSRASKSRIWTFAEELRQNVSLTNGFQLADLVKRNGGEISYINFLDVDQTDAIVVQPDNSFTIRLSSQTGSQRDNFTIAHELGHLLLHWPIVQKTHPGHGMRATRRVEPDNEALTRCEWEANWFASAFLMPADEFEIAYKKGVASDAFGVTSAAVAVRAKTLGLSG